MAAERREADSSHEVRLEGIGLLLGGGLLLALLVGAFLLGRWVERRAQPSVAAERSARGPLSPVVSEPPAADAAEGLTHFDTIEGAQKQAEPRREVAAAPPPPRPAQQESEPARDPAPAADADLPFYVQVMALRDEQSAASTIRALERKGYSVRLFTEREGGGTLYKVRVGGFAAEPEARAVVARLRDDGYPGAFVRPAR